MARRWILITPWFQCPPCGWFTIDRLLLSNHMAKAHAT